MRSWFWMITVALTGVLALSAQGAYAATWVPQWGAHKNERSGGRMNDYVGSRHGTLHGVVLGRLGPAGKGTADSFDGPTSVATVPKDGLASPKTNGVRADGTITT